MATTGSPGRGGVKRGRGRGNFGAREQREEGDACKQAIVFSLLPRARSRALIPFPLTIPFERLPRRLELLWTSQLSIHSLQNVASY